MIATLPNLRLDAIGGIHPFVLLTMAGLVVCVIVALRRARGDAGKAAGLQIVMAVLIGAVGGQLLANWGRIGDRPLTLLLVWIGFATALALPIALVALGAFTRLNRRAFVRSADHLVFGFVFGWILVRVGCTTSFDHVGPETDFFLEMEYVGWAGGPISSGPRHNLGFYDLLLTLGVAVSFLWARRRRVRRGWYLSVFLLIYIPGRFAIEFLGLRAGTLGLTPFQWVCLVLFGLGVFLALRGRRDIDEELAEAFT